MTKREILPLENGQVRLRLLNEQDLPLTLAWRNQDGIRKWFFSSSLIAPDQHQGWYEQYCQRDDDFVFIIEEVAAGYRPVGQVALYHIDWSARCAEYGRLMIGEPMARGKGLARAATDLVLQIGMDTLQLEEIYLEVFAANVPALKVYNSCGFEADKIHDNIVRMTFRKI